MKSDFLKKQQEQWDRLIQRGINAGATKNLKEADSYFEAAHKISRHFPKNHFTRRESAYYQGYSKFVLGEKQKAKSLLREFLEHPLAREAERDRVAGAWGLLGDTYAEEDQDKAITCFEKTVELYKELGQPISGYEVTIGDMQQAREKFQESIPWFESAYYGLVNSDIETAQQVCVKIAYAYKQLGSKENETKWQKENLKIREQLPGFEPSTYEFSVMADLPPKWGKDGLSHFFEGSRQNELSTFVEKNEGFTQLLNIFDRFMSNRKNLILTMMPVINERYANVAFENLELEPEEWLETFFYLRTLASFAGAAKLCASAQIPEMYMVARGCIENAIYAFYIWKKPELKSIWLNRNNSVADKRAAKSAFVVRDISLTLAEVDPVFKNEIMDMYDETIDQGAHPNVSAFLGHAVQRNENNALYLSLNILNSEQVDPALANLVRIGELAIGMFQLMYPGIID